MKVLVVGSCSPKNTYSLEDPSIPSEDEFTSLVVTALSCVFSGYRCVPFSGRFLHEGVRYKPDLALVARDFSHWLVVEVELATHSLDGHVLPQVRAFRFGEPDAECGVHLARALNIPVSEAHTLVRYVPRSVVVVANRRSLEWEHALRGAGVQLIVVSMFSGESTRAMEVDGNIDVAGVSVAFGRYSAVDRAVRVPGNPPLADGVIQLYDSAGAAAMWTVRRAADFLWLTRAAGEADLSDQDHIQIVKTVDGRLVLRQI